MSENIDTFINSIIERRWLTIKDCKNLKLQKRLSATNLHNEIISWFMNIIKHQKYAIPESLMKEISQSTSKTLNTTNEGILGLMLGVSYDISKSSIRELFYLLIYRGARTNKRIIKILEADYDIAYNEIVNYSKVSNRSFLCFTWKKSQ